MSAVQTCELRRKSCAVMDGGKTAYKIILNTFLVILVPAIRQRYLAAIKLCAQIGNRFVVRNPSARIRLFFIRSFSPVYSTSHAADFAFGCANPAELIDPAHTAVRCSAKRGFVTEVVVPIAQVLIEDAVFVIVDEAEAGNLSHSCIGNA